MDALSVCSLCAVPVVNGSGAQRGLHGVVRLLVLRISCKSHKQRARRAHILIITAQNYVVFRPRALLISPYKCRARRVRARALAINHLIGEMVAVLVTGLLVSLGFHQKLRHHFCGAVRLQWFLRTAVSQTKARIQENGKRIAGADHRK